MQPAVDNISKLETEIIDLVTEIYDIFSCTNDKNEEQQLLSKYIRYVAKIGLKVRKSGYLELQDFCVAFQEILRELLKQERKLSSKEREYLELWPSLVLSAITSASERDYFTEISRYINHPVWQEVVPMEHVENLQKSFPLTGSINNESNDGQLTEKSNITISDDYNNIELIQQEILEATSELISEITNFSNEQSTINTALNLCADRIEVLSISISSLGYLGLMDICSYYQLGLRNLARQTVPLTKDQIESIQEFPSLLLTYISDPDDLSIITSITQFLKDTDWISSISDSEESTLNELLLVEFQNSNQLNEKFEISEKIPNNEEYKDEHKQQQENEDFKHQDSETDAISNERKILLASELINLIIAEVQIERENLSNCAKKLDNEDTDSCQHAMSQYNSILERLSIAIESVGLSGLYKIINYVQDNITLLLTQNKEKPGELNNILSSLPGLIVEYLENITNSHFAEKLVNPILETDWEIPFKWTKKEIINELVSAKIEVDDETEERTKIASNEDVSLELPKDVNQQLLTSLLQELPSQTAAFSAAVSKLYNGNATINDIEHAQRIAHTLKGASNTVGVVGIATLTHHTEDILTAFTRHNKLPNRELADVLINTADVLEMMSEVLLGTGNKPDQALSVLQQILDWANHIDQHGIPDDSQTIRKELPESDSQASENTALNSSNDDLNQTMLRVPATLMDELLRLAGESIIMGGQLKERLIQALLQNELAKQQNVLFQQLVFDLDQIVDIQRLTSKQSQSGLTNVFDALELEQYNELHTITHRLVEAVTDSKEQIQNMDDELSTLDNLLAEQGRIHKESQDVVMQTRMVPIQNIVPRLQRCVRQTCRSTNKMALLDITGADTMMDSDVLNEISEPLMHILRNAIDHGIEVPEKRKSTGKNETGYISLSFNREGEYIIIRCKDDGAGLDFETIRNSAIKKGLITEDSELSDDEYKQLISISGFSTSAKTTQVSGRGIGMSAIYNSVTEMKGTLTINSEKDNGCTFEIRLPLTLISVHSILVKHKNQTLAFSNRGIEQILSVNDGEILHINEQIQFKYDNTTYDCYDIETLLHHPITERLNHETRSILLVRNDSGKLVAITIEQVIANQDLVVKQLGIYVPEISGIEGATILGNGNIVPVIDLPGLLRTANDESVSPILDLSNFNNADIIIESINVLVVDDSLSARRSLAQFVEDIGYDVRTARDGIDAIEAIEKKLPDIIFVDLEMPRMNGLELTSHLRSNSKTKNLPVIMVTSRSTEKHRQMALSLGVNAYVTKPFSEDELLEHIDNLLTHKN